MKSGGRLAFPLAFVGAYLLLRLKLPESFFICALASLAMPLGLNTVVIPSAYGKDTSVASGMALISHLFSLVTFPLLFLLAEVLPL